MTPQPTRGAARRLRGMHDLLLAAYGPQHWWPASTPFEVVIGAYLTQNTAWTSVERSLEQMRAEGILSLEGLRAVALDRLQELIRPSGFASRKAPALKAFVSLLDAEFGGSLDAMAAAPSDGLREKLLGLPGVGPETADAILLYALGHPVPVADEYLRRVTERHGLLEPAPGRNRRGYAALAELTRSAFDKDDPPQISLLFNEFHALTVAVGKGHCRRNAHCSACPLRDDPHLIPAL
jgi:endonuclease III related protein